MVYIRYFQQGNDHAYALYMVFIAGKWSKIRSYTVYIFVVLANPKKSPLCNTTTWQHHSLSVLNFPVKNQRIRLAKTIIIYGVYTAFLAGNSPNIRSYTVHIYGSGQPYQGSMAATHDNWQHHSLSVFSLTVKNQRSMAATHDNLQCFRYPVS